MKVIAVDPNPEELIRLSAKIRMITPQGSSVECFCDPLFAHQYSFYNKCDVLFAAAHMSRMTGLELAKNMRSRCPDTRIFILWSDDTFRQEALELGADGYLLTPPTADALRRAMEDAEKQTEWE